MYCTQPPGTPVTKLMPTPQGRRPPTTSLHRWKAGVWGGGRQQGFWQWCHFISFHIFSYLFTYPVKRYEMKKGKLWKDVKCKRANCEKMWNALVKWSVKRYEMKCEKIWNGVWIGLWKRCETKWNGLWTECEKIWSWVWIDVKWNQVYEIECEWMWMDMNGCERIWNEFQCVIRTEFRSVSRILVCDASANWGKEARSSQI